MEIAISMPKLGLTMTEGTVGEWLKAEGDRVARGEPVVEVMTEKITNVVEAPVDGILSKILAASGEVLAVGAQLGTINTAMGAQENIRDNAVPVPSETAPPGSLLTPMRQAISRRMLASWQVPQVTIFAEAEVASLEAAYRAQKAEIPQLTFTSVLLKILASVLKEQSLFRSYLQEDRVYIAEHINIGVAIALPEGLVVPVLADADQLSLAEINDALRQLVSRARGKQLTEADLSGSVFTLSNLGGYEITYFTPLLNPPEAAILGVGRIKTMPNLEAGKLVTKRILPLSLTHDHRLIDGATAAQFLQRLQELLADKETITIE
ncbi:dihydrolipoamide acetyltransferase family protein [Moorella naiadis]|uniref:dihydrolipoamide acetyltransferase family protein n=1 Tax=Moorella naiadis (nom. illeg.) TaxID=3093670 RepID=UPI003D9C8A93